LRQIDRSAVRKQAMFAKRLTMVGSNDDECIFAVPYLV